LVVLLASRIRIVLVFNLVENPYINEPAGMEKIVCNFINVFP